MILHVLFETHLVANSGRPSHTVFSVLREIFNYPVLLWEMMMMMMMITELSLDLTCRDITDRVH